MTDETTGERGDKSSIEGGRAVPKGYSKEDLLEQIALLGNELDRSPSFWEFEEDGRVCHPATVKYHFESWADAVEKAGYEPLNQEIPCEEVLEDIQLFVLATDHVPRTEEFNACPFVCTTTVVYKYFDGWGDAVEAAGFTPRGGSQ